MAKALKRSKEEWKVKADHYMVMNNTNRVQIVDDLSKDLKKVTPPTFYGIASKEDVEAWITSMKKYFLV